VIAKARRRIPARAQRGFTLLEVLVAVAILAMSLTSLLGSQMNSMLATRYARSLTQAVFLGEAVMHDTARAYWQDGWVNEDVEYKGSFEYLDAPDMSYYCLLDYVELPQYSEMVEAVDEAEDANDGGSSSDDQYMDTGEQAFGALGTVWPIVKTALENSIRKQTCTVRWKNGKVQEEFSVVSYTVNTTRLLGIPEAGGETTEADDDSSDGPTQGSTGANGQPGGGPGMGPGGMGVSGVASPGKRG
jgi:general secretion pathway protein I